jgi:2-polyprenyl-6-methoxyphenol hydroxylase-like FAD-dependent oxidoreductase
MPLTDGVMALLPEALLNGPALVMPAEPATLFMAAWRRSASADALLREIVQSPEEESDYVVLGMGARRPYFGLSQDVEELNRDALRNILRQKVASWHPNIRKLVELMSLEMGITKIRSSQPVPGWKATNVTLLGDAIHAMTPFRGIGANVALRDADLLCQKLVAIRRGRQPLAAAIGAYEAEMRAYGFAAVAESKKSMEQAVSKKNFGFKIAMSAMRAVNAVPVLRRRVLARA